MRLTIICIQDINNDWNDYSSNNIDNDFVGIDKTNTISTTIKTNNNLSADVGFHGENNNCNTKDNLLADEMGTENDYYAISSANFKENEKSFNDYYTKVANCINDLEFHEPFIVDSKWCMEIFPFLNKNMAEKPFQNFFCKQCRYVF